MNKLRFALVGAVVTAFTVLGLSAPASAYPDVTVSVTSTTVVGGTTATITASTSPAVDCDWDMAYKGQTATGSGSSTTHGFSTTEVSSTSSDSVTATCEYNDGSAKSLTVRGFETVTGFEPKMVTAALQTVSGSGTITLLPRNSDNSDSDNSDSDNSDSDNSDSDDSDSDDSDDNGGLPDTGGERLLWLLIGLLLVVGGATVIVTSRKDEDPEALT